jgi:hypothetical protein
MKFKADIRQVEKLFEKSQTLGEQVIEQGYDYFKGITPIRSGNARRNTHLDKSSKTIIADYPYAQRLDQGYSQQAANGMSEPTLAQLEKWAEQELRKLK